MDASGRPTSRSARGLGHALSEILRGAVVEPVRRGRPRFDGLTPGIGLLARVALALIVVSLCVRLLQAALPEAAARILEALSTGTAIGVVFVCAHLAAPGLRRRWRAVIWAVLLLMHLVAGIAVLAAVRTLALGPWLLVVSISVVGLVPLVVGTVAGLRRPGSVGSLLAVLVGLLLGVGPGLVLGLTGDPQIRLAFSGLYVLILLLPALALALAAPVSLASLAANLVQWSALGFRDVRRPAALILAWGVVAVIGLSTGVLAIRLDEVGAGRLAPSAIMLAGGLGLAGGAMWWALRRGDGQPVRITDLAEHLAEIAMPLGVLLGLVAVILPSAAALGTADWIQLSSAAESTADDGPIGAHQVAAFTTVAGVGHVLAGVVVLGLAISAARRGRTVPAIVLAPIALSFVLVGMAGGDIDHAVSRPAVVAALGLLVAISAVLAHLAGRMDTPRWTLALMAQLLCAVWPWYPDLLEPLGLLACSYGLVVLVLGLLWYLATEAEYANAHGGWGTRPARMLIFCAHSGSLVLFAFALDDHVGAAYWETFDESLFTVAVPLAALVMMAHLARRDLDPRPPPARLSSLVH